MSIYEKLNDVIYNSDDLVTCGQKLIKFADAALMEKNKATIVKCFYKHLIEYTMPYYVFDFNNQSYAVFERNQAVSLFLLINLPSQHTPVKSLKTIETFGEKILTKYTSPIGSGISKNQVEEIMTYLNKEYEFSRKVFKDKKAMFLLLNNSHVEFNSECRIAISQEGQIIQHLFLYHMRSNDINMLFPESVLFHELGHALHARLVKSIPNEVPPKILDFLETLCFPTIKFLTPSQQCEVFADVISIGMMYNSPFSIYDPFPEIHEDDKKIFNMLFKKIISFIK